MTLTDINGSLTSLSETKGFRNYFKTVADQYGIRGSIKRIPTVRAQLELVCTETAFLKFLAEFLDECAAVGMFRFNSADITLSPCRFPPQTFQILCTDRNKVENGAYSSNEFDRLSHASSADREYGPSSHKSGDG